jgi:hypothetical protein
MAFKRKTAKAKTEDAKQDKNPKSEPSNASEPEGAPANRTSLVGYVKSLMTPLNVVLVVLILINCAMPSGKGDDSKTNLRNGAKTPTAEVAETPTAPPAPKFTGVTGKVLLPDAVDSVLNSGRTNIALKKPAAQASDYNADTGANNAVDGERGDGGKFTHTTAGCNDWWQVDLQGAHSVEDVIIFNRAGIPVIQDRLSDFFVEVLALNGEVWDTTGQYHSEASAGARMGVHFEPGAKGTVVRIRLNTCEVLHMQQVEVYGTPV